jgi:hypothetical protein
LNEDRETLFLALCRPPLTWGVPFEVLAMNVLVHLAGTGDSVGPIMVHPTESHLRQPAKK